MSHHTIPDPTIPDPTIPDPTSTGPTRTGPTSTGSRRTPKGWRRALVVALPVAAITAGYAGVQAAAPEAAAPTARQVTDHKAPSDDEIAAITASAGFQDVVVAESAGYSTTVETLGCFQNPGQGGMGVHYLNGGLLDATVDVTQPEALVYELTAHGEIAGLVAHEYIVPVDAWTSSKPPSLFGMDFHRHATLPLWVLHAWLWKDNPTGTFADWNPAVRLCPAGTPVFGVDLPEAPPEP